jgi:NAD(P)-dependent dehydrogenase (short-subunit alcohol dehydrogenase family)
MEVDLKGVWLCMKYELLHMKEHGGGAIVNTSSEGGFVGTPLAGLYVAAKHGVMG